jgi:hypothetical protein
MWRTAFEKFWEQNFKVKNTPMGSLTVQLTIRLVLLNYFLAVWKVTSIIIQKLRMK